MRSSGQLSVTMRENQSQNRNTEPQSDGASYSTGFETAATFMKGFKPMKPPKRGCVIKQILNDICNMWKSPSTEAASS
ncbi:hypothetical protein VNO78_30832 [Psophocarpus tetragonolobus]|uniref:Uncharacterized protein n=1 Tax=Psophocarpus tetragonolobus TaxID=3891 RepID=A0AAN9RY30_PSOTE